jgi:exonuclease SbcC
MMRLHHLTFQAIGPFAGRHTVDFSALAASGLFLLEGPTGAGKSTVIDAIVFALYGQVAGEGADGHRMRSDHADLGIESFVELVYETASGIYKVRRSPKYERAKQRGEGTTTQQATAKVWRLTSPDADEGEIIASKVEEAATEIQRTIGLSRAQFVQTVVLPQGQFASFLKADTDHRREVLQTVFGTEVYQRWMDELTARRAAAHEELTVLGGAASSALDHLVAVAGVDDEAGEGLRASLEAMASGAEGQSALMDAASSVAQELENAAKDAAAASTVAAGNLAAAQTAYAAARTEAQALARRDTLRGQLAELEAGAEARAQDQERVAAARRAAAIKPVLDAAAAARKTVADAEAAAAEAQVDLSEGLAPYEKNHGDAQAGVKKAQARHDAVHAHDRAADDAAARQLAHAAAREDLTAATARAAGAAAELARVEVEAPAARKAVDQAEKTLEASTGHAAAVARRDAAKQELAAALGTVTELGAVEARLREERIKGIGAELALDLADGAPCPVCGSLDHPAPAQAAPDQVGRSDVDRAERGRQDAERHAEDLRSALAGVTAEAARLKGAAGGIDVDQARAELDRARDHARAVGSEERARKNADAATEQVAELTDTAARLAADAAEAREKAAALEERSGGLTLDRAAAELGEARAQEKRARTQLDTARALSAARQAAQERADAVAEGLTEQGFSSSDQAEAAYLPAGQLDALSARLTEAATQVALLTDQLDAPDLANVEGSLAQAEAAAEEARLAQDAASATALEAKGKAAVAAKRADDTTSALDALDLACALLDHARADAQAVIRVANLAAGTGKDNLKNINLPTYVLMRRFEEVIDAANARLVPMSSGRFALERSDEKEATRARRTGLSLKVMDGATGETRDPRTLSGGETFYVSLALALGLADVVTAEAGGVDLGTLFIDEGFGSLDGDVLDSVLAELGHLRAGGRTVGVVSHVDALKQSIAERIEVRRLPDGSSTLRVVA